MLKQLNDLTAKLSNIEKRLRDFGLKINDKISLSKIRDGFVSVSKHIKTVQDLERATLCLCGSLQKLERLGIELNEHDLWFISGYKTDLKADYEYRALLRVASNHGYPAFVKFEYILKDEKFSTSYGANNRILINYTDEGRSKNITLKNMAEDYRFFFCLIDIHNKEGKLIHQQKVQMSPEEILTIKSKTKTKDSYQVTNYGKTTTKYSVWSEFTKQMVQKTLVKNGFRMLRETIPSLGEFYEFEEIEDEYDIGKSMKTQGIQDQEPKFINKNSDLDNPTEEQKEEIEQVIEEYKTSPALHSYNKKIILGALEKCGNIKDFQSFVNVHIVKILALKDEELRKTIKDKELELSSLNLKQDKPKIEPAKEPKVEPKKEPQAQPKTKREGQMDKLRVVVNATTKKVGKSIQEKYENLYVFLNKSLKQEQLDTRFNDKNFQKTLKSLPADKRKEIAQLYESLIVEFKEQNVKK